MKMRITIIISVILVSIGCLVLFTGSGGSGSVVIADVHQVVENPSGYMDREVRVRGFIKAGTALRYGDKADFILTNNGKDLKVHFDGSTQLPDTFGDGAPARADGRLDRNMRLVSNKVEAKCASKYDAKYAERPGMNKPGKTKTARP